MMFEIPITEFKNLKIGNMENTDAGTGCTVFLFEKGAPAGLDVRGGGPASEESELLKPMAAAEKIHAIVLSGGSAFGLEVCQSCLFDLSVGDERIRPDKKMGYCACENAEVFNYQDGNYGAGTGATVGKLKGMDFCMKSGIGSYAVKSGALMAGAVVAVNSLGDVYDWKTGQKVAGLLAENKRSFGDSEMELLNINEVMDNKFVGNTTIAVFFTNARFDKTKLGKIAGMAHDGYARSIRPVHTTADGDSIYAVSLGEVNADLDVVGTLAARVISEAIIRAVEHADSAYGYPATRELLTKK